MAEQIPAFLKGQLLLAMPGMIDPNFTRTVTCLYEHTENGAVGGIVNRIHPTLSGKTVFRELKVDCLPDAEKNTRLHGGAGAYGGRSLYSTARRSTGRGVSRSVRRLP